MEEIISCIESEPEVGVKDIYPGKSEKITGMNTEFSAEDYDEIKKVYSIWICMESPEKYANTITLYSMEQKDVYGEYTGKEIYDLLSVVIVRLSAKEKISNGNTLHKMLTVLLSHRIDVNKKVEILQTDYGLVMNKKLKGGMEHMCNLSLMIREEVIVEAVDNLMENMQCTLEKACELLKISIEEYHVVKTRIS